jgi:iron complex outermembrane receptor protein
VRTPRETATVSVAYRMPVAGGNLNLVVSDYFNSGFAWDPDSRPRQSSYDVANASVDWNAPKNSWDARLWGRHLTGSRYCAYATATTLIDSCAPAPPRTYGLTIGAHF